MFFRLLQTSITFKQETFYPFVFLAGGLGCSLALLPLQFPVLFSSAPQYPYLFICTGLLLMLGSVRVSRTFSKNLLLFFGIVCLIPQTIAAGLAAIIFLLCLIMPIMASPLALFAESLMSLLEDVLIFWVEIWGIFVLVLMHLTLNWVIFLRAFWFPIRMPEADEEEKNRMTQKVLMICGGVWGAHHWADRNFKKGALYMLTCGGAGVLVIRDVCRLQEEQIRHRPPPLNRSLTVPPQPITAASKEVHKEPHWILQYIIPAALITLAVMASLDYSPGPTPVKVLAGFSVGCLGYIGLITVKTFIVNRGSGQRWHILRHIPKSLLIYYRILPRTSERIDRAAMASASANPILTTQQSGICFFHSGTQAPPAHDLMQIHDTVRDEARAWSGIDDLHYPQNNYRVLVFDKLRELQRYSSPYGKARLGALGMFSLLPTPRILLQREWTGLIPGYFDHTVAHECVHALHITSGAPLKTTLWQMEGISQRIARRTYPVSGLCREVFEKAEKADLTQSGSELIQKSEWTSGTPAAGDLLNKTLFYYQSALLTEWLVRNGPENAGILLFTKTIRDTDHFTSCFGVSPDDAMTQALAWRKNQPTPSQDALLDLTPIGKKIHSALSQPDSHMTDQLVALSFLMLLPVREALDLLPPSVSFRHKSVCSEAEKFHAFLSRLTDVE